MVTGGEAMAPVNQSSWKAKEPAGSPGWHQNKRGMEGWKRAECKRA